MNHVEFFGCKHPIMAAPMNQVSDVNLAVACHNAGILPSLSVYTFKHRDYFLDHKVIDSIVKEFQDRTGSSNILLNVGRGDFLQQSFFDLVQENKIKFLELIPNEIGYAVPEKPELYRQYLDIGVVPFSKRLDSDFEPFKFAKGVILKGKDGAGRINPNADPLTEIKIIKEKYPELEIVMSGGIGCRDDVKMYLDAGCIAVGIGTLLAASEESCLSKETKLKMLESSWNNVSTFSRGAEQNGLVFSHIVEDDFNHTESLKLGIKSPTQGHIFAGKGINHIKSILPVKDIVQLLVDGL
jgi:hypothetical protein